MAGAAVLSSVTFIRGMVERTEYAAASPCSDRPGRDCYVDVAATVVGKRVDARSIFVDDHVLELNEPGGPEVTLADGRDLWAAVAPGQPVTLRHWRGQTVHVTGAGHQAETVGSPRIEAQRLYAASLGTLGFGGLLIVAGLGLQSVRKRPSVGQLASRSVLGWVARVALAAVCVGVAGAAAEIYTRAAPMPLITVLGLGALAAGSLVVRVMRTQLGRRDVTV